MKQPLKEIEEVAGRELGIRIAVRTGDTTPAERAKMTKNPPHIFITTPESLAILLNDFLQFVDTFGTDYAAAKPGATGRVQGGER